MKTLTVVMALFASQAFAYGEVLVSTQNTGSGVICVYRLPAGQTVSVYHPGQYYCPMSP